MEEERRRGQALHPATESKRCPKCTTIDDDGCGICHRCGTVTRPAPRTEAELTPEASREVREAQANSDKEVLKIWNGGKPASQEAAMKGANHEH